MDKLEYERCVEREVRRRAKSLKVADMKEQLGLTAAVRGHTKMKRHDVVEAWVKSQLKSN